MIEFRDVTKAFGGAAEEVVAVKSLDLEVAEGELLCLIGTSGCGKTTTLKMVNRLLEPTAGQILVDDEDVMAQDPIALRRRIGYVVQSGGIFPHLTVAQNIGLLAELEGWSKAKRRDRVHELLELVNMDPEQFADRFPRELSGGQRQRIGVARALVLDPAYILMDEPFGALDPITRDGLHDEFLALKEKVKKTIVMVTHDMEEAFKLGDRVALMHHGELLQVGTLADFRERPATEYVEQFLKAHFA